MTDPYSVLGVTRQSSDEEIKRAYRELAKKYHPDAYVDNPLSDLAQEKMEEINKAYDAIMAERKNNANNNYSGGYSSGASQYPDIRNLISCGRYEDAQELLDGIPLNSRNAEWYFLNGSVLYKRGWFDNAYTSLATACRMDPNNQEYRAAFNQMQRNRSGFNNYGGYRGSSYGGGNDCSACDVCSSLLCADCCCECMGGDLIPCC